MCVFFAYFFQSLRSISGIFFKGALVYQNKVHTFNFSLRSLFNLVVRNLKNKKTRELTPLLQFLFFHPLIAHDFLLIKLFECSRESFDISCPKVSQENNVEKRLSLTLLMEVSNYLLLSIDIPIHHFVAQFFKAVGKIFCYSCLKKLFLQGRMAK